MMKHLIILTCLLFLFPNSQGWSLSSKELDEATLQQALDAHKVINFKRMVGSTPPKVLLCPNTGETYRVEFPIMEDCNMWKTNTPDGQVVPVTVDVLSHHPATTPMRIFRCQKITIDYDVAWQVTTNKAVIVGQKFSLPTEDECGKAPIHSMDPVLDISKVWFLSSERRTLTFIKKEQIMTTYYTSVRHIMIPDDGSKVDIGSGGYVMQDVRYFWGNVDLQMYETKRKLQCDKSSTAKGDTLYYCDSFNALYTVPSSAARVSIQGVDYVQALTGEFISTDQKANSKGGNLKLQNDEVSVKIEGEGHMINLLASNQHHNYLMNKCWHRNHLIMLLEEGTEIRANEMEVLFDMKDALGVAYPKRGFFVITRCKREEVFQYMISETTVLLKDAKDNLLYYDPQTFVAYRERKSINYSPGTKIPFLDGEVLDYSSGKILERVGKDKLLYHYSELSSYDENAKPRWNPATYQKDFKPKTTLDQATDKVMEMMERGILMIMTYVLLFSIACYLAKTLVNFLLSLGPKTSGYGLVFKPAS